MTYDRFAIGASCILFGFLAYLCLTYFCIPFVSTVFPRQANFSKLELTCEPVISSLEEYKKKYDKYPDSLLTLVDARFLKAIPDFSHCDLEINPHIEYEVNNKMSLFSISFSYRHNSVMDSPDLLQHYYLSTKKTWNSSLDRPRIIDLKSKLELACKPIIKSLEAYKEKFHKYPKSLRELVSSRFLLRLPDFSDPEINYEFDNELACFSICLDIHDPEVGPGWGESFRHYYYLSTKGKWQSSPDDTPNVYEMELHCKPLISGLEEYYARHDRFPGSLKSLLESGFLKDLPQSVPGIQYGISQDSNSFLLFFPYQKSWGINQRWHHYYSPLKEWESSSEHFPNKNKFRSE